MDYAKAALLALKFVLQFVKLPLKKGPKVDPL